MRLTEVLYRASSATRHELAVRGRQLVYAKTSEILGLFGRSFFPKDGHLRSLGCCEEDLPQWFADRRSRFFIRETRAEEIRRIYAGRPEQRQELLVRAGQVVEGKMYILGHGLLDYSMQDRWHRDVVLGVVAPKRVYSRIRYLTVDEVGDSKHVWEPNRFGWVYCLGAAYVLTADDRYAQKFRELTLDWFEYNPYPVGINYCSALEIALRAYAWSWAISLFRGFLVHNPRLLGRLLQGIWLAGRHVENNLSYYFSPNTHLMGEAFGLFACGAAVPEFDEAERWRSTGETILAEEADKQFHRDGTHRELSSCYHLYATDFYVQASLIAEETGFQLRPRVRAAATKLANRLAELAPNDGHLPQLNDCDGGRLTWFCQHPLDATPTLLAASYLPGVPRHPAADREICGYNLWMARSSDSPPSRTSPRADDPEIRRGEARDQYDSGTVTYTNDSHDYLLFRSGPFGYRDCGHSHDAPTSFLLYLAGQPLIVDCGVGHYTQNLDTRNAYRAARGKNILLLDDSGPSLPGGWFSWKRKTPAALVSALPLPTGFFCRGSHDGFTHVMGFAVSVNRAITLLDIGVVVVIDTWEAARPIHPTLTLTLHPDVNLDSETSLWTAGGHELHYWVQQTSADPGMPARQVEVRVRPGPHSPAYGIVGETRTLTLDYGFSRAGSSITIFSRIGPISTTEQPKELMVSNRKSITLLRIPDNPNLPVTH